MSRPLRFDAAWNRKRRRRQAWRRWRWAVPLVLLGGLALWQAASGRLAQEWEPGLRPFTICGQARALACVVDGDTVRIGARRIRLTGFDAPEMDGACAAERVRAVEAREELAAWLNAGAFEMDGGADPPRDQYGRELRAVRRTTGDGGHEWLAEHMVAADLADGGGWLGERDWCTD